jgi:probable rRNA maturation factor
MMVQGIGPDHTHQAGPVIDVSIESEKWRAIDGEAIVRRAIAAAGPDEAGATEISVVLTDDESIRALNAQWRGKDEPTNVLSFPAVGSGAGTPQLLGDIVIAYETAAREALNESKPIAHHVAHLAVHGFLHLMGYDHESDAEAEAMESREREILARLGIPDPYTVRD